VRAVVHADDGFDHRLAVTHRPSSAAPKERGVLIVALMAGIAIVMILSTVAVQAWSDVARRDAEAEMIFRAQDIARAIKRFQVDRGRLPTEMKELLEVGSHRPQYFIRQLWKDPLVKDGKWQLLYASPAGGLFDPTAPEATGQPLPQAPETGAFQTGLLQKSLAPTTPGGTDAAGGIPSIARNKDGTPDLTGLPIAGVKSRCKDRPFRRYKDKDSYSEWVFSIFDLEPRAPAMGQQPPGTVGQPGTKAGTEGAPSFPPR